MAAVPGLNDGVNTPVSDLDRWLRSPDHQQVMRLHWLPGDESQQVLIEVRSVMGGLPSLRRLSRQAAVSAWNSCRQNGWTRCHPQW